MVRLERVQVRFPDHLKKRIEEMAIERGQTEGNVVVDLVERALSVDPEAMNEKIIGLHETVQALLNRVEQLEKEKEG